MTRKDYILIADVIQHRAQVASQMIDPDKKALLLAYTRVLVSDLSRKLKEDNSRFDASKFVDACGF